ncbi:MAG: hypothetical protein FWG42_11880 [Clostridiales bacterium]|nr:hypothetical protein [Clostridiales bacterium]
MRKLIYALAVALILTSGGCNSIRNDLSDDPVNGGEKAKQSEKVEDSSDVEALSDIETSSNAENDFVDFSKIGNWEVAYLHMQKIGKPVREFADNYSQWKCIGAPDGYVVYRDPENELHYAFDLPGSLNEYYKKELSGNEICMGIEADVGLFFQNIVWPQNISDVTRRIKPA